MTRDNILIVKGQHEEKADEHGSIERKFVRKYVLPKECNLEQLTGELSRDDVLIITAPKLAAEGRRERIIPVTSAPIDEKKNTSTPIQSSK